ncbi:hypothetical protein JTB14_011315 [Gonioctena quinquepunctata]|nr:hypothetical protein JTB14_011315 [Gonioctena quinquepunctata]
MLLGISKSVEFLAKIQLVCENTFQSEEKDAISCYQSDDTTAEDTVEQLTKCYEGLVNKTTSCLNEKYLPQVLLDLAKAIPRDDYEILNHEKIKECRIILQKPDVKKSVLECLSTNDKGGIPPTKSKFCENLRLAARCTADVADNNCEDTPSRKEMNNRFMKLIDDACE